MTDATRRTAVSDVSEAIRQFENSPGWWDEAAWERVKAENARLREQRDKAEATLEMVKALADGYDWLSDGRGPYAYDDGRYDDDVRQFVSQLLELLPSGNWLGMREWEAKYRSTEAENARLRERAEALAEALEAIVDEGPICFPEDKERCHCCEGTKEHGHADGCDWVLGRAALRAYREPWATVHTKYLDDQLVERCITCLECWPCKEDNHDDRR